MTSEERKEALLDEVSYWADESDGTHDAFYQAILNASRYATCVEIAGAAGMTRQGIRKILNRYEDSGNVVDNGSGRM